MGICGRAIASGWKLRRLRNLGVMVAGLVGFAASIAQAGDGWYLGGRLGPSILPNAETDDPTGVEIEFNTGFSMAASIGYAFSAGLRLEVEANFAETDIDQFTRSGFAEGDDPGIRSYGVMGNIFYDFDTGSRWTPYIGGGAGIAVVDLLGTENHAFCLRIFADSCVSAQSDTVFAYQVGAGIGYEINPSWTVTLDYRFVVMDDPEFEDLAGAPFEFELQRHDIHVGVRVTF